MQRALNEITPAGQSGGDAAIPLRLDGVFGPKTRRRLDDALMAGAMPMPWRGGPARRITLPAGDGGAVWGPMRR